VVHQRATRNSTNWAGVLKHPPNRGLLFWIEDK